MEETAETHMAEPALPLFENPPVAETVMGVFFVPCDKFSVVERARFWLTDLAGEFPMVEERPPLDEVREEFGRRTFGAEVQVRWQAQVPSPRLWAKSEDGKHTIQIQGDALLANWERDPGATASYLPYAKRRVAFATRLEQLRRFMTERHFGDLSPTTCFISYINHFELPDGDDYGSLFQRLFTVWSNETSDRWLPRANTLSVACAFDMPEQSGRLHVKALPAVRRADQRSILRLDLTARGKPKEQSVDGAMQWLDRGHEWVVRAFASLTRREMHQEWGRSR